MIEKCIMRVVDSLCHDEKVYGVTEATVMEIRVGVGGKVSDTWSPVGVKRWAL